MRSVSASGQTTVPVQMRDKSGSNLDAYLWQYGQPEGSPVFEFALTRAATEPKRFLAGYGGMLQTDGYQAYERVGAPGLLHLGCWAHYPDTHIIRSVGQKAPVVPI